MSYSGKQHFSGDYVIRDIWTYIVRFIVDSGYWSIVDSGISNSGVGTYSISQDITVSSLDTWLDLQSADAYDVVVKSSDGSTTYVEGTDYEVNYNLGRIKFLSSGSIAQNDTVHIDYTWKREYIILYSTGVSGTEKIYIGAIPYINSDGVHGYINWKAYKFWQEGMSFGDTSLGTKYNSFGFALWSSDTDLWLFIDQQRVILVTCIQTYYSSAYIGFFNRFLMPHEYNYPLCIISSEWNSEGYDSTSDYRHFIPNSKNIDFIVEDNTWKGWYQSDNPGVLLPNQQDTGNLVQVHYPSNASIGLLPIYLYWNGNIYGQLDDVYFTPASILSSESEITIGNDTYIVFEDVFRHGWSQFMAIKEA